MTKHFLRAQHLNSERRWQVWQLCQVLGFQQVRFKMLQGLKRQSGRFGGHLSGAVHLQIAFLQNLEQSSVSEPQCVLASWCMQGTSKAICPAMLVSFTNLKGDTACPRNASLIPFQNVAVQVSQCHPTQIHCIGVLFFPVMNIHNIFSLVAFRPGSIFRHLTGIAIACCSVLPVHVPSRLYFMARITRLIGFRLKKMAGYSLSMIVLGLGRQ